MPDDPVQTSAVSGVGGPLEPAAPTGEGLVLPPTPLQDALAKTGDWFDLEGRLENGQASAKAEGQLDVGKEGGWMVGGAVQIVKGQGTAAWAKVTWRPR